MKNWKNLFGRNLGMLLAAAFFTLVDCIPLQAQDVTISPQTGTLLAALTQDGESGSPNGWSSTWKHNQLPLTLTVSDFCNLTSAGETANPAGNIINHNGKYVIIGGANPDLFLTLSLPKGFKFIGYEMVLLNNVGGNKVGGSDIENCNKIFFETDELSRNVGTKDMIYNKATDYKFYSTIRDEIYDNNPHYLAVARKKVEGKITDEFRMDQNNEGDTEYVISRTEGAGGKMSNHLYFRLSRASATLGAVTIKSIIIYFSAEGDFTETVSATANTVFSNGVNYAYSPFTTSKLDLGNVELDENGHYTYKYYNVKDMEANNIILQADAVDANGALPSEPGEGTIFSSFDGTNYHYALKNNTYYVECPVSAPTTSGEDAPIGFRIVDAKVNYSYGTPSDGTTRTISKEYDQFYITYKYRSGFFNYYYYLNSDGKAEYYNDPSSISTYWFMDEDGYVRTGDNGRVYLTYTYTSGNTSKVSITTDKNKATQFKRDGNTLCYSYNGKDWYLQGNGNQESFRFNNNPGNSKASLTDIDAKATVSWQVQVPAFTPGPYTITVYDKTGKEVIGSKMVNSNADNGHIDILNINNDAVKFVISGLEGDAKALVTVDLTMQALDPYINSLNIVCQEKTGNGRKLRQQFTASNFAVRGGKFNFYVPEEFKMPCIFTFEDLYSKYGDNTYYKGDGNGNSRYNFVKSEYWDDNSDLYSSSYDPDADYKTKVKVGVAGTKEFKFNNAEEVASGNASHLIEYPFSLAAYQNDGGVFETQEVELGGEKTAYLFTCDETRYNISPVTATQHRYYAYYQMDITLKKNTYTPDFKWETVYEKTFYGDGNYQEKPMYGVKALTTKDDQGQYGYLTVSQITKALNEKGYDKEQILYVDGSDLLMVVQDQNESGETNSYDKIKDCVATNAVVYLPEGTTTSFDNFAYKTETGSFQGAGNFIFTDKYPFYAPLSIQVAPKNYAKHERLITNAKNGKVTSATIIMPFQIAVDSEGKHTNVGDTEASFSLHTMQAENCILDKAPEGTDPSSLASYAFFPNIKTLSVAEPNKPYVVKVLKPAEGAKTSFVITQEGTLIEATKPTMNDDYTFTGETAKGIANGVEYTFTNNGTYSGKRLPKNEAYFYFAQNKFVCSKDLDDRFTTADMLPFRAYYSTTGTKGSNIMSTFEIIFGEGEGNTDPTGINNVDEAPDLVVAPGVGTITMASTIEQGVKIYNMNGVLVDKVVMGAGETKTVNLPAGMYIVNDAKLIVR